VAQTLRLTKPLERSILAGHPWIYSDALMPHRARPGDVVDVADKRGRVLARGLYEGGPIAVRVFTTRPKQRIDAALFRERAELAFDLRKRALPADTTAYRLLHGEGDRLPGVVCDRYGEHAVIKLDGEAIHAHRDALIEGLQEPLSRLGVRGALLRSSRKQGLGVSLAFGEEPARELEVLERGMRLIVNPWEGQKTGLFLDHRESRARVRGLSRDLRVLNLYGYTGGFSVAAGLGGARHVTTVDVAHPAIDLAVRTFERNGLPNEAHEALAEDVPAFLSRLGELGTRFDLIIADPPNFAPSQQKLEAALESYRVLHGACLSALDTGGLYLAASCSSHVRAHDFIDTLREGARRARRVLQVLEQSSAPFDHPRLLAFPEGDYLKVVLARVL
jgi:23S rRNA (cytosine1962-C5)-methyltransferase